MRYVAQLSSTALSSAEYDDELEELSLTFTSGQTFTYSNVPMTVFENLRDSRSPGQFYHQSIKGHYV
jgi:KTSC domain